jgi:hypothetical protein
MPSFKSRRAQAAANAQLRSNQPLWCSSDEETSSEEDLDYLEKRLTETHTLPAEAMTMLRAVVSNTYKDRKYPGRFGRG